MKAWISIALVLSLVVAIAVGGKVWRDRQDAQLAETLGVEAQRGLEIARANGCIACHSLDGSAGIGPSWRGVFGAERPLADGGSVIADADYLRESITDSGAQLVAGYQNVMLSYPLPEADLNALVALIRELSAEEAP